MSEPEFGSPEQDEVPWLRIGAAAVALAIGIGLSAWAIDERRDEAREYCASRGAVVTGNGTMCVTPDGRIVP
jgi:hypothetical protein